MLISFIELEHHGNFVNLIIHLLASNFNANINFNVIN